MSFVKMARMNFVAGKIAGRAFQSGRPVSAADGKELANIARRLGGADQGRRLLEDVLTTAQPPRGRVHSIMIGQLARQALDQFDEG